MSGLANIIGQKVAIKRLREVAELFVNSGAAIEHILLIGPSGSGRSTLAHHFAEEYRLKLTEVDGDALQIRGDLTTKLTNLESHGVLCISEVGKLRRNLVSVLSEALATGQVVITIGSGNFERQHHLDVPPFTCILTALKESECPEEILSKLTVRIRLSPYSREEAAKIAAHLAMRAHVRLTDEAGFLIADACDRTPGAIERLVKQLARIGGNADFDAARLRDILTRLGVGFANHGGQSESTMTVGSRFESLVENLLSNMGFITEKTAASSDGGIDIVALLNRPIVGGKYLIQCKCYSDGVVGAPVVRDFYGALSADKSARKGIIITTSSFSSQAREFAEAVGVELVDGDALRILLLEHGLLDQAAQA